jgi:hypothetical protein
VRVEAVAEDLGICLFGLYRSFPGGEGGLNGCLS